MNAASDKVVPLRDTDPVFPDRERYMSGFGNEFATEAVPDTLPIGQNSPQRVPHGLYAEQISGTAFTAPRHSNRRSWLYRIKPAAVHSTFEMLKSGFFHNDFDAAPATPNQLRWDPLPIPETPTDFVDGLVTMAGNGSAATQSGIGIHVYAANRSMQGRFFYDADGELIIVPQLGKLRLETELGEIHLAPQEIAVIPRGIRFRVELLDGEARGYVAENFGAPLRLPDLGPIGSNGLANARDFLTPVAAYQEIDGDFELVAKAICGPRASIIRRSMSSHGTAITRRTNTICAASTPSVRSRSIIPTRLFSRCSPRRAIRRASRIWIS